MSSDRGAVCALKRTITSPRLEDRVHQPILVREFVSCAGPPKSQLARTRELLRARDSDERIYSSKLT
jgi:hypothetical protein